MLIIGPTGSGKTNALLNLIQQDNNIIDKIYLYAKDLEEQKYLLQFKKRQNAGIKNLNDTTAFIEYSNTMDDIYDNIDDYNAKRKIKVLIMFDDMINDVMTNKKYQQLVKGLFIRSRKLNISLVFLSRSYFRILKDVRLNSPHYLPFKVQNRKELQQICVDHSADIDYKDFLKIYRNSTKESANDPIRFRKNFSDCSS